MTKLNKEQLRESFRPNLRTSVINSITKKDPNNLYKCVRYDEQFDPNAENIDKYLDLGWEIVTSTETLVDDRKNTPGNNTEESLRPKPVTKPGKGGAQFVLMKISKEKATANDKARQKRDEERYLASTKRQVKKSGNDIHYVEPEVNEQNIKNIDLGD